MTARERRAKQNPTGGPRVEEDPKNILPKSLKLEVCVYRQYLDSGLVHRHGLCSLFLHHSPSISPSITPPSLPLYLPLSFPPSLLLHHYLSSSLSKFVPPSPPLHPSPTFLLPSLFLYFSPSISPSPSLSFLPPSLSLSPPKPRSHFYIVTRFNKLFVVLESSQVAS